MNLNIDDALEQKFREVAPKIKGFKKGHLQEAVEEALRDWIDKNQRARPKHKS